MGGYMSLMNDKKNIIYQKYGWKRDLPDKRDYLVKFTDFILESPIPKKIDLREKCPKIYDQGVLGSCTANAIGFLYQYDELKQNVLTKFRPSRLFIYYNEREIQGNIDHDCGSSLRDGMKTINKLGVCSEEMWDYDITKYQIKPTDDCYSFANLHKSIKYSKLSQKEILLKTCLNNGYPFAFGISIYESFESEDVSKNGVVPIPSKNEKLLGGHAMAAVGYDDEIDCFIVRNSWGVNWGINGYCYIPYKYITDPYLANDFWKLEKIKDF